MEQKETEGKQTTPDLDRIMQDGRPAFVGAVEPEADATGPVPIGHNIQNAQEPTAEPTAKDEEAVTPAEPPTPAMQPAVTPPEPDGKGKEAPHGDYRFKTLEDADKSYRLLQAQKTKADQKLKALEAEKRALQDEQRRKEAEQAEDQTFLEFTTERNKKALAEINDLNPDDPEYTAQAAACWARAHLDVRRWKSPKIPDAGNAEAGEFKPPAADIAPEEDAAAEATAAEGFLATRDFVESVLEGANLGIPKGDPLFWSFAEQSPSVHEDGTPIPLKDQIWWAVQRTLNYHRDMKTPPAAEASGLPPAPPTSPPAVQPMGRSGAFRPGGGNAGPTGPVSLAEAVESVMEMRRL